MHFKIEVQRELVGVFNIIAISGGEISLLFNPVTDQFHKNLFFRKPLHLGVQQKYIIPTQGPVFNKVNVFVQ